MAPVVTPPTGLTIKAALVLGFGLTLGFWLVTGYQLNQRFSDVESSATAFNTRYLRAQETLREVDSQVRTGSVLLRDALLSADPASTDLDRASLEGTYSAATAALQKYVPVVDSTAEREAVARLRREIDAFRAAMLAVLDRRDPDPVSARRLLQQRVVPQRDAALRQSARSQTVNREAFVAQTLATAQVYRQAQRSGWEQLGLALAANIAIGMWALLYAGRLENRLRRQRARDLELTSDLHRLSAKIVSAQEDERRMIARELHDEVGQTLAAIRVELAFAQRPDADASAVASRLDDVRTITEGALHMIRDLSHLLHPPMLDDLGLIAALESLIASFSARHGVKVELRHKNMDARLSTDLETAVYRIVQEALSNVAKHARARTCRVSLERSSDLIRVAIEDDGAGFAVAPGGDVARSGLGLIGVRERATLLGGTLNVVTASGEGTRLYVELPTRKDTDHGASANLSR
jgi:signal transduction histidine kinase